VTVDDHRQGVTEIVRGADLLDTTFMQIRLQQLLGYATPQYMHVPIVVGPTGEKLSKQTGATATDVSTPVKNIFHSLVFLKQNPPESLRNANLDTLWEWGRSHWRAEAMRGIGRAPDIRV
jgi:glutamyl-Q tRNA(Asp) synthetase